MEKFLCVLGIFDGETQKRLGEYQQALLRSGFTGRQTMGIPFHLTLGTFDPDCRAELLEKLQKLEMRPVEVFFNHIGMFEGQEVLFLAPDVNRELLALKEAFSCEADWTAHATMLMDSRENILCASRILGERFRRFTGQMTEAALYEFFPAKRLAEKKLEIHN